MITIEIQISIPIEQKHSPARILRLIAETLEERFSEIDDGGNGEKTIADTHGFGGNTITLTFGKNVEEICL